ncbi:DUF6890 family protein [Grimontia sp. NTOU-MAR1]
MNLARAVFLETQYWKNTGMATASALGA